MPNPTPFSHVEATRTRWAAYGPGFAERHPEVYRSDLESAARCDGNAEGNRRADAALKACGDNREAALEMLLGSVAQAQRVAA